MWFIEALEIVDREKGKTGKFRLTARCDEPEQGPSGNPKCYHDTPEECFECEACDRYTSKTAGFPMRAEREAEMKKMEEREALRRVLRAKVFIAGAQAMRELIALRLQRGATEPFQAERIGHSVRSAWHPSWGTDPGQPAMDPPPDDLPAFIDALIKDMPTPDVPTKG